MIKFTQEEISNFKDMVERYRDVSSKLMSYQKQAEEIQEKVISLNAELEKIKQEESSTMSELHKKYGDFGIQDVYNSLMQFQND